MRRAIVLLGLLVGLLICWLALRPTLERMRADARRIDAETEAMLARSREQDSRQSTLATAQAAVDANPSDVAALLQLASVALEAGQVETALDAASRAVRQNPSDSVPALALADIQQRSKRYDEAIITYRRVLAAEPHQPRAVAGLSFIYLAMGWTIDATDLLEAALKAHPDDRPLRSALALASIQHNDFQRAEKLLKGLEREQPDDPALWGAMADMYLKASRPADALVIFEKARLSQSSDPRWAVGIAQAQLAMGKAAEAEKVAAEALAAGNETLALRWYRAIALNRLGKPDQALTELEALYSAEPEFEDLRLMLGQALVRAGRKSEGQAMLSAHKAASTKAAIRSRVILKVSMNPKDARAHLAMAKVYEQEGSDGRMRAEASRALELEPGLDEAKSILAKERP